MSDPTENHDRIVAGFNTMLIDVSPDVHVTLDFLAKRVASWNEYQGFWDTDNTGEKLMLMVSELGEALEAHRKGLKDDHLPDFDGITVELADCIIRILDYCGHHSLPLGDALLAKLRYNLSRPRKHGKAY